MIYYQQGIVDDTDSISMQRKNNNNLHLFFRIKLMLLLLLLFNKQNMLSYCNEERMQNSLTMHTHFNIPIIEVTKKKV